MAIPKILSLCRKQEVIGQEPCLKFKRPLNPHSDKISENNFKTPPKQILTKTNLCNILPANWIEPDDYMVGMIYL